MTYFLLDPQRGPVYPGLHVQRYPVDLLPAHDPLLRHGENEQMFTKTMKIL